MRGAALELWGPAVGMFILIGSAPGFLLRLLVRIYPKNHPRRRELVAELYTIPYREQLLFVAQQMEVALTEGIPARWRQRKTALLTLPVGRVVEVGFRGPQVCKVVGITYRQLDYWARTDLIRPSLDCAEGSGTQRRYSYRDLVDLKVIKGLLDAGVSLQSVRVAIEYLRTSTSERDIGSSRLVLNGRELVLVRSEAELANLLRLRQGVFSVVALDGVTQELDRAITDLKPPDWTAS